MRSPISRQTWRIGNGLLAHGHYVRETESSRYMLNVLNPLTLLEVKQSAYVDFERVVSNVRKKRL
jgi:hypothetical protein